MNRTFVKIAGNGGAVFALWTTLVCPAAAQVVAGQPGTARGLLGDGGGATGSPTLALTIDLNSGYDDIVLPASEASVDEFVPLQSGYASTAAAGLRYQVGTVARHVLGLGSGSISQQQIASGLPSYRLVQGQGSLEAATNVGRRSGVSVAVGTSYEPTYLFGAFDSLGQNVPEQNPLEPTTTPTADPTFTLTAQRWLASRAGGRAHHNWTSRQRMNLGYEGTWVRPVSGLGFESQSYSTSLDHTWRPKPTTGVDFSYRYQRNAQTFEVGAEQLFSTHTAETRLRYERRLSPRRSASFMVGGGLVKIGAAGSSDRGPLQFYSPTISGAIRVGLVSAWGVSLSVRRDVTVLYGLSAEPFESDAATLGVDGSVKRRLWMGVTGGYTQGRNRLARAGDYEQRMLNAQLRYAFGAHVGVVVLYSYSKHELRNVAVAPSGFPAEFGRNSVRVGLTMWLPLYGSF